MKLICLVVGFVAGVGAVLVWLSAAALAGDDDRPYAKPSPRAS